MTEIKDYSNATLVQRVIILLFGLFFVTCLTITILYSFDVKIRDVEFWHIGLVSTITGIIGYLCGGNTNQQFKID